MRPWQLIGLACLASAAAVLVQAGPLNPPAGQVAPTYKTLAEIDPGIPLASVSGGSGATHLITQPGRYYLTTNMTGVPGEHGIAVAVPDVTIDLCGFTLQGASGSLGGIVDLAGVPRVTVRNGNLKGWGLWSVATNGGSDWTCRDLNILAGGNNGIFLGPRSIVEMCTVIGPSEMGISTGGDSRVSRCTVSQCTVTGIYVAYGSKVESCVLTENSLLALQGGEGVAIADCTVSKTHFNTGSGDGIVLAKNGIVERCVIRGNEGTGVYSDQGGTIIRGCKIDSNKGDGINVFNSSLVVDNEVHANGSIAGGATTTAGIRVRGTATRVESNHIVSNNTAIKIEGTANLVVRNSFSANGAHIAGAAGNSVAQILSSPANGFASTDPWANFNY